MIVFISLKISRARVRNNSCSIFFLNGQEQNLFNITSFGGTKPGHTPELTEKPIKTESEKMATDEDNNHFIAKLRQQPLLNLVLSYPSKQADENLL